MIDVNIKGVLYGIAAALPYMPRQKSGHFINVSSVAGQKVDPGFAAYAATKHAVRALSRSPSANRMMWISTRLCSDQRARNFIGRTETCRM